MCVRAYAIAITIATLLSLFAYTYAHSHTADIFWVCCSCTNILCAYISCTYMYAHGNFISPHFMHVILTIQELGYMVLSWNFQDVIENCCTINRVRMSMCVCIESLFVASCLNIECSIDDGDGCACAHCVLIKCFEPEQFISIYKWHRQWMEKLIIIPTTTIIIIGRDRQTHTTPLNGWNWLSVCCAVLCGRQRIHTNFGKCSVFH